MNRPIIKVKISELQKAKWNYKTEGSKELIQKLIHSATYQKSIGVPAVRELNKNRYEVIDGNHRLDALIMMKVKEIQVENFGKISKGEAVLIAKQRNTLWFEDDTIKFAELFRDDILKEFSIEELEKMLPMTKDELEGFEKLLAFDWDQFNNAKEPERDGLRTIKIIVNEAVYKQWEEWIERCKSILDYENEARCFEFAIQEALNIPEESLK